MKIKKILVVIAIFTLVFPLYNNILGSTIDDLNKQLKNIQTQKQKAKSDLADVDEQIQQDMYELTDLKTDVEEYSIKLQIVKSKVDAVNEKIEEYEDALQNSSQKYNSAEELYKTRLRAIYENGIPSIIEILLSSKGISDFFAKMNVYTSILEYDKSLVGNIQGQKEYIDFVKKDMEVQKLQLEQLKYDVEKSTKALEDARVAQEKKLEELQSSKSKLEALTQELASQEKEASNAIAEEVKKMANVDASFEGQFTWPVPGFNIITARYGVSYSPFGNVSTHTGTDIAGAGIFGTPILAIESGTVVKVQYGNTGYGNHIIIDHGTSTVDGNNYKSLYGHAVTLNVSQGQKVNRGDVIAYVGSTGYSTGPHLHLEIYKNGVRDDALKYYPDMKLIHNY